jgi:hypothetical protein
MKKVKIIDESGNTSHAVMSEADKDLKKELEKEKKANLKEHLYMGYLIIGTIAFTLGILISIKRLKDK